ncbi:MAG: hypothetical protein HC915_20855, partial [Anaerolineae bacterium]|nr:hypothetical protein [Anaerolineae bacterium]
ALAALPDARPVMNANGLVALYTAATDRYPHAVLGDALEGGALVILATQAGELALHSRVDLPASAVFEGVAPFWADLDVDGLPEVVTTVSAAGEGARLRVYRADGAPLTETPPIGLGFRWRHQLAVAFFDDGETPLLVEVRTPHLGGVVGFWRLEGDMLVEVGNLRGYTSHLIRSPNLDMAVAGDFSGDGLPEIVLMNSDNPSEVVGLQFSAADGVLEAAFRLQSAPLSTNFAPVHLPDGRLVLGYGTEAGTWEIGLGAEGAAFSPGN